MRNQDSLKIVAALAMQIIAACGGIDTIGESEAELRNCPGGECEPPPGDDGSGDPIPPQDPLCSQVCTASEECGTSCRRYSYSTTSTTCGTYGTCVACSASTCTSDGCWQECLQNGVVKNCDDWGYQSAGDADLDGVPDALEIALARKFFPTLRLRADNFRGSTEGDWGQLYSGGFPGNVPNATWPFIVRPVKPYFNNQQWVTPIGETPHWEPIEVDSCADDRQCLEIVYLIPYNWDLGDTFHFWPDDDPHKGDSEGYAVLVTRKDPRLSDHGVATPPRWDTSWDAAKNNLAAWIGFTEFAAAHLCATSDSSEERQRIFQPEYNGSTTLWVAEGKHGSYFGLDKCDWGAFTHDNCDHNSMEMSYATQFGAGGGPLRNAGEDTCFKHPSINPFTVYPGAAQMTPSLGYLHHVWGGQKFGESSPIKSKLRRGTLHWWTADPTCWPDPAPPPSGSGPPPIPQGYCSSTQHCCDPNPDGTCNQCISNQYQCP